MLFYSVFLSPLFFFFFFSFLSLCPTAHSLCSALPNSSLNLSQTLFLSLALALPLSSASAQAQSRTCTPTLIGSAQAQSMALSPSWVAGPWVVGRPRQWQTKELNRLVVVRVESACWYLVAWDLCLGGCHGIRWLVSLPLLGRGCRQNGLWWVWIYWHGYGGCGFGFAGVGVGVMGGCRG
jgi:hypothetical protein